ncbi:MAG TPA: glutamate ABC transporter permease [Syntrophobacteraceae bacterium]|nr:glutamate ABC transporter permease [Syntrophobacteraceae bacterium]
MLNYSFDWSVLWREPYGQLMLSGMLTTVHLSLLAWVIALVMGLLVGICGMLPNRITRLVSFVYVQLFRSIPLLLQLFIWYFAVPLLLPRSIQRWLYANVPSLPYLMGVAGLGLYTASRVAELVRAGLQACPRELVEAAYANGLTTIYAYRYVIVPYAVRIIIPPLTSEFLTCFKNSALTMTIGVMETTGASYQIDAYTYHGLETTTAASLVYVSITLCVVLVMSWVEKRFRIPGMIVRGS